MKSLSDFANIRLGFKSLLNDFFYVSKETVDQFGIEHKFLKPIFKLADLDGSKYLQSPSPSRWMFNCKLEPGDLRGTGAKKYIDWGAQQETTNRRQSDGVVRWSDSPAKQAQKHWYWPAAPLHLTELAVRKGVGDTYAPYIFQRATLLDQRLYLVEPREGVSNEAIAAFLCSSMFALALETDAEIGMGGGVLTVGADALRGVPSLDLDLLTRSTNPDWRTAYKALIQTRCPSAHELKSNAKVRALDEAILEALGHPSAAAVDCEEAVSVLASSRTMLARQRSRRRTEDDTANIQKVADVLADRLGKWLDARRLPEDVQTGRTRNIDLPAGNLRVSLETLLGESTVVIQSPAGATLLDERLDESQAKLLVRSLQLGRRSFELADTPSSAESALKGLRNNIEELRNLVDGELEQSSVSHRFSSRVENLALGSVGIDLRGLESALTDGVLEIANTDS